MKLDLNQKNGLIELISFVIGNRINDKATSLSYMELLDLKNVLRQDEEEEEEEQEILYTLTDTDTIHIFGSHSVKLNEEIRNEEMHEYCIVHRESLVDDLYRWIGECTQSKQDMIDDLDMIKEWSDDYILSSISTNAYISSTCSEFNETCKELIELNKSL